MNVRISLPAGTYIFSVSYKKPCCNHFSLFVILFLTITNLASNDLCGLGVLYNWKYVFPFVWPLCFGTFAERLKAFTDLGLHPKT